MVAATGRKTVRTFRSSRGRAAAESATKRLLVDPVLLDDLAAHAFHCPVHRAVGLEDPAHLTTDYAARDRRLLEVFEVETSGDAAMAILVLDAQRENAALIDLALAEQELEPAERGASGRSASPSPG